ncbi:flavin-containing monooxygenase [Salinactinospora qingdaonensis]|uniref:NAD(P)/FAD-dependent oxidoreductase n=1 Tax=Salinactinospora qingdaonensis TaxID=702744 RepID=A0ABP7G5Q9_9ACTN
MAPPHRSPAPPPEHDNTPPPQRHVRIAIIGSGFSGLGMGVKLREAGETDFLIVERANDIGGTWRDNTYPGCACDVPSHLYSFSFAPNPDWPHTFSRQPHIRAYLEQVADRFGLRPHIATGTEVCQARWDTHEARWHVHTSHTTLTCDILISAAGPLADPALPDIPGLDTFPGALFHSARWNHDVDLTGKHVAVVGTGASAIQIVPAIQPHVGHLTLFQRTPAWVMPRADRPITSLERWLFRRVPLTQRLARAGVYLGRESTVGAFTRHPRLLRAAETLARLHLRRHVSDPHLRAKLTPDYVMGCKRILLSNDYYPALTQPNVDVVAAGLSEIRGDTAVAADGTTRPVEAIIFGTGFHATDMPIAHRIVGAEGHSLAQAAHGSLQALRGTTVTGFPNLFLIIGPNTGLGHTSMIHIIESQLRYIIDALDHLNSSGATALHPSRHAQQAWNADLQHKMDRTVWAQGGCASWYIDANGRNTTLWPGSTLRFRRATRRLDPTEYQHLPPSPETPATASEGSHA